MQIEKFFHDKKIRIELINNEPWFVAKDVCELLEHTNTSKALSSLSDSQKGITTGYTLGGNQELLIINESGLYRLIFNSRKPQAEKFTEWVTGEVLPSIRKTGSYTVDSHKDTLILLRQTVDAHIALLDEVEKQKPKIEHFENFMDSTGYIELSKSAKVFGLGRNRLFAKLRDLKILDCENIPYQRYVNDGYFVVKEKTFLKQNKLVPYHQTLLTPKGELYLAKRVK